MAHATTSIGGFLGDSSFGAAMRAVFARLADRQRRDAAYRQTLRELEQMSDRDLNDIGITRFMIADVAAEAAARA